MAGKTRSKAAGYHGVQNMKFAPKKSGTYDTALLDMKYAQSINPSALLEAAEQYADNRLVCRVPSDTGYEGEVGTTAPDPELEKAAGFALEGANGLITTNIASYLRGALYYEFLELDEDGKQSVVKCWMFNVEIGKGSATYTTAKGSVEFGAYSYPFRAYGDPLKDSEGTDDYKDERGVGRTAYLYTCGRTIRATRPLGVPWLCPGQGMAKCRKVLQHLRLLDFPRLPKAAQKRL